MTIAETFDDHWQPDKKTGCHVWLRSLTEKGYGRLYVNGKRLRAHRFAYERAKGPIPAGLFVLHDCDVKPCVNPEHLYVGTNDDNVRDRIERGSQLRKFTVSQVQKIRLDVEAGAQQKQLAIVHRVTISAINCIVKRKNYRWVE